MQKILKVVLVCVFMTYIACGATCNAEETDQNNSKIASETKNASQWPTTVEAVVLDLLSHMPPNSKEIIRKTKKEDLIKFHFSLGMGIRNEYGLWRGNEALIKSACGNICHPDDASMVIIEALWTALQHNDKDESMHKADGAQ